MPLFLAVNFMQMLLLLSTEELSLTDTEFTCLNAMPFPLYLSRDMGYSGDNGQISNETNWGHISTLKPYSNQVGTMHREPLFGLGNGANKWQITRSADP
jgi:hypothetical protein